MLVNACHVNQDKKTEHGFDVVVYEEEIQCLRSMQVLYSCLELLSAVS